MSKTTGVFTPGGMPMETTANPLSMEISPKDSGEGCLLHNQSNVITLQDNPFQNSRKIMRSPESEKRRSPSCSDLNKREEQFNRGTLPILKTIASLKSNNILSQKDCITSVKESNFYDEWQKAVNEKNQQTVIIRNLQQQIDELKKEMMLMKHQEIATQKPNVKSNEKVQCEYFTDEEDLAKETEWIRVKNRKSKKRKLNNTPSPPQKQQTVEHKPEKDNKKIPPPPPIIVDGIKNYHDFYDIIKQSTSDESFSTKLMNENKIKINVKSGDAYRSVVKTLSGGSFIFHTYENKQERPIRVMVKNLHHTCNIQRIRDDLASKNYKVTDVMNKISFRSKKPLDMFIISFSCEENTNRIYEITSILGCKVAIEPLRKSKLIPQCKKCQAFGHTQKYCGKQPRCVKCAGHHLTGECTNPKEAPLKCIHCGEAHPASYRGCMIAKEIQRIKNKKINKTKVTFARVNSNNQQATTNQLRNEGITYAQITAGTNHNSEEHPDKDSDIKQTLQAILMKLTKFDDRLQRLEDRAMGAKPKSK